ncbi:MAG: glycosyltransferase family 2 protein [Calothrix sp. MO_192.B10]|nr:glycosyltransferase family 2 protein [Calothrix sp. MO_192.B10]
MKISIVTPIYNSVHTIEKTIQSVINQKIESELEYIVVDGGSSDGTVEIINRYLDKIDIFISEKDRGAYDAMNKGITHATGDIIGIINADDWYNNGALKIVETIFAKETDASIVYSPIDNYSHGNYLNTFIPGELENLVFQFTLNHPSCFVKSSVYDSIGLFDLSYAIAADYDFIFRAYTSGYHFRYVDTPLASYSLDGMSGQRKNRLRMIQEGWRVGSKFVEQKTGNIKNKRRLFYINFVLRELVTSPIKNLDPLIIMKIKAYLRQKFGIFTSGKYGTW